MVFFPRIESWLLRSESQAVELKKEVAGYSGGEFPASNHLRGELLPLSGLAASLLAARIHEAVMAVLTADHSIGNVPLVSQLLSGCV